MFEKTTYKPWKPFQAPYGYRAQSEKIQQDEEILSFRYVPLDNSDKIGEFSLLVFEIPSKY